MPRLRVGVGVLLFTGMVATAFAQDKQRFEFKFEKDKPFYQEMTTEVAQTIKVQGGSDLVQKHKQTFQFKWTPVAHEGDKWTIKQAIEGVKMAIDIAGNTIEYDSANPTAPGGAANPNLADFFSKLVGSEFTVTLNAKTGTVEKVEGRDDFLKKLAAVNPQMEGVLKRMLTDEALKQMTDPTFGMVPPAEKAVGETWERKSTLSLGPIGSYEVTYKYTYKGKDPVRKELDRIEVETELNYQPPADQAEGLLFRIKGGDLKSEARKPDAAPNYILFDPKTGRIEESSVSVRLKGTLNVTIGGTDTNVELYQEQTTTVKTSDTSFLNGGAASAPPAGNEKK